MAKKMNNSSEEVTNWVVGKEFSRLKLMNLLGEVDTLETIAEFGYKDYDESIEFRFLSKTEIDYKRIKAFELLISKLIQIINNTDFAIINLRKDMCKYLSDLKTIQSIFPRLFVLININNAKLKKNYPQILQIIKKIKRNINTPLYKNNLIYITKETFDPLEQKKKSLDKLANI